MSPIDLLLISIQTCRNVLTYTYFMNLDVASRNFMGLVFGIGHSGYASKPPASCPLCSYSQFHKASPTSGPSRRTRTECLVIAWYAYCIGEKQAFPELAGHRKPVPMESVLGARGNQGFL